MLNLPQCPGTLPSDIEDELHALAARWAKHSLRPRLEVNTAKHWNEVIRAWSEDLSMPLFLRKSQSQIARGEVIHHFSGRALVLTDNSPTSWVYMAAYSGQLLSLSDIKEALAKDLVPVSMVLDRSMKEKSRYKCCRVSAPSPNSLGWKVCHKIPVGMGKRIPVQDRPIEQLKRHFCTFLSPSNLFLIPLKLGGLGETKHFIDAIGNELNGL